jgi:hypothetical protein
MMDRLSPSFLGKVTSEDLLPINVGGAKTPKHPIIVFRILD